ncbi:hypothetical protein QYF36_016666 [Acer negundo]|nr:hypothetical protein QYF36_016666 [Acer negundo]
MEGSDELVKNLLTMPQLVLQEMEGTAQMVTDPQLPQRNTMNSIIIESLLMKFDHSKSDGGETKLRLLSSRQYLEGLHLLDHSAKDVHPGPLDLDVEPLDRLPLLLPPKLFELPDLLQGTCVSTSDRPFSSTRTKFSKYFRVTLSSLGTQFVNRKKNDFPSLVMHNREDGKKLFRVLCQI